MSGLVHNIRIVFGAQTQPSITIQQSDYNSRTIQAACFTSSGTPMDFSDTTVTVVYNAGADPTKEYPVTVEGNNLSFTMPGLAAQTAGSWSMQIFIYWAGSLLHSAEIPYTVLKTITPGTGGDDPVPALVLLIQQAQEAIAGANEAASTANQAAGSANSAANSANEKAGIAASAANSANEAASNAATMASLAQTATANANSAANSASNAAESANQAAASANAAAASASQVAADVQQKADSGAFNGKNGLDAPQIDDTQITTTNPWSSMQIVKTLCPPFAVSGATVQCTPVANYPLGVQVEITPTQEGTGDPSPENVRPIVGWEAVNIHQSNGDQDKTYPVQLGQTVYGGTLDVGTEDSERTVDVISLAVADMDNGESFPGWKNQSWITDYVENTNQDTLFALAADYLASNADGNKKLRFNSFFCVYFEASVLGYTQSQIKEQYPNLVFQFAFRRITPEPFHSTSTQQITALSGTNTLYADAGDITVTGASDPIATITALQTRVSALESAQTNM